MLLDEQLRSNEQQLFEDDDESADVSNRGDGQTVPGSFTAGSSQQDVSNGFDYSSSHHPLGLNLPSSSLTNLYDVCAHPS